MKHRGPELEWWIEVWQCIDGKTWRWEFHGINTESRDAARAEAGKLHRKWGGRWRVLDVAKWPVEVLG